MADFVPEDYVEDEEPLTEGELAAQRLSDEAEREWEDEHLAQPFRPRARTRALMDWLNDEYNPTRISPHERWSHPEIDGDYKRREPEYDV